MTATQKMPARKGAEARRHWPPSLLPVWVSTMVAAALMYFAIRSFSGRRGTLRPLVRTAVGGSVLSSSKGWNLVAIVGRVGKGCGASGGRDS